MLDTCFLDCNYYACSFSVFESEGRGLEVLLDQSVQPRGGGGSIL